jgi:hypothetical protein
MTDPHVNDELVGDELVGAVADRVVERLDERQARPDPDDVSPTQRMAAAYEAGAEEVAERRARQRGARRPA